MTIAIRQLEPGVSQMQDEWPKGQRIPIFSPGLTIVAPSSSETWGQEVEQHVLPTTVLIGHLLDDRLRLPAPVSLDLEKEGDFYIARCDEFEEFGYSYSPFGAVDDFRRTLTELYWTLKKEQARLSPSLTNVWQRLSRVVREV